jgi:dATP pyrophosphohydrolase
VPEGTEVVLNHEHDAFEWVSFDKAHDMLGFSAQRKVLAAVETEFVDKDPNPHLRIDTNG